MQTVLGALQELLVPELRNTVVLLALRSVKVQQSVPMVLVTVNQLRFSHRSHLSCLYSGLSGATTDRHHLL
jgi:hypothetical protein